MKTRCPFGDCAHIFDAGDDMAYKPGICAACSRPITIRSLERHEAVDHVVEKHRANGTLFLPELFQQQSPLPRMVAVLEDIRSLWNVGSMFRTADGSGCQHLIVTGITGYPPRKEIEKTSLGAEAVVSWNYAANSMSVIPEFKKLGYQILSLEKDEKSLPLSTVIGGESSALSALHRSWQRSHRTLSRNSASVGLHLPPADARYENIFERCRSFRNSRLQNS